MPSLKDTTRIRTLLLQWYRATAREFPWRSPDVEPYVVFVSEIMLQQTQASRVAELLPIFLERFPDFEALAQATNADVIMAWKGLGYNNRALRLRDAARAVVSDHAGVLPQQEDVLRTLPGIGPYASAAISTFAFNTYTVVIDVNVRRVYSRLHTPQPDTSHILADSAIRLFGYSVIPKRNTSEWHHAVMDLGATICKARTAQCTTCPLQQVCPSAGLAPATPDTRSKPPKKEPLFRGEPRRIWRGRVVAAVRDYLEGLPGGLPIGLPGGLPKGLLVEVVFGSVNDDELDSVDTILSALVKDRLITLHDNCITLAD